MRTRGVMVIRDAAAAAPERLRLYETFAALTAIALERVHYVDVARDARLEMESERLRNSVLAALSHDLRTPLAALLGLSEAMTLTRPPMSPEQLDIARALGEEARRLISLVNNLLDMARMQSGAVRLDLQWQPLEEVVGSAIASSRAALGPREVTVRIPGELPLVHVDAVLMERVLANLLENAGKYTPADARVTIDSRVAGDHVECAVEDDGPGVAAGEEEAIFEKFVRGAAESATPGVGLGLAICRAIVEAHGGTIRAEAGRARGARFVIALSRGEPPEVKA
jgi:two-component system sensor histidine kinase KdpD